MEPAIYHRKSNPLNALTGNMHADTAFRSSDSILQAMD
jgi:hypothetical protein